MRACSARIGPVRLHRSSVRPWAVGAILAVWFAVCAVGFFSENVWPALLFGVPFVLVLATAALTPVHIPSSALFTSDLSAGWTWFARPYAGAWLWPLPLTVVAYAGACVSHLSDAHHGLSGLLNNPDEGWWWPLFAGGMALLAAFLVVLLVLVPVRAAIDAVGVRSSDRAESRRLAAFVVFWIGLAMTIAAQIGAYLTVEEDSNSFTALRDEIELLTGRPPNGVSTWWVVLAWAGVLALVTVGILYWAKSPSTPRKSQSTRR